MAAVLIKHNQWLQLDILFNAIPNIISNTDDINIPSDHFISVVSIHSDWVAWYCFSWKYVTATSVQDFLLFEISSV